MLHITYNICSSNLQIHEEINHLKSDWQKNTFPLFFIDNCIHEFLNKLFIKPIRDSTTTQKKEITISLEYLGKISLLAKKQLTKIFRSCYKDIILDVVFKTSNRLLNSSRFKVQLPKCISSKVSYKYKCDISNNVYIGKTKRHLIVCQYEHLGKLIATDKPLRYSDKDLTPIRKHCHGLDCLANIDNFSILRNAMKNCHLLLEEFLLIFELKPLLNVAKESIPVYLFDNHSDHY